MTENWKEKNPVLRNYKRWERWKVEKVQNLTKESSKTDGKIDEKTENLNC